MAKKKAATKTVNKSKEIRDYKAANPEATPMEIAEALTKKHNIEFTNKIVSTVLYTSGQTSRKKKKPSKRTAKAAAAPLDSAIEFVKSAGGLEQAKAALQQIEEIKRL